MSDFKSGEKVVFNKKEYIYLCEHPEIKSLSVLELVQYEGHRRSFDCVITEQLERKPKTHRVNGFEVPAQISQEEFNYLGKEDTVFYCSVYTPNGYTESNAHGITRLAVSCGFIFKTEDDIKKNILAMQGIDPSQSN